MALVVSSSPLAALWSRTAASSTATATTASTAAQDERRPAERAASSASPSSTSTRRLSSGSSNSITDTSTSGSSSASCGTQRSIHSSSTQSSSSPASVLRHPTAAAGNKKPTKKKKNKFKLPDVVLHVQDCSFTLHQHVVKRRCRVLFSFLQRLRTQNAVGELADNDRDDDGRDYTHNTVAGGTTGTGHASHPQQDNDEDYDPTAFTKGRFVLRQRNPLTTPRRNSDATLPHQQYRQRCPMLPRQYLSDRAAHAPPAAASTMATASTQPSKPLRFSRAVCCIAHQKSDDEIDAQRPRSASEKQFAADDLYSPGKENYVATTSTCTSTATLASTSTVRPRPLSRIALAPKMPFMGTPTTMSTFPATASKRSDPPSLAIASAPLLRSSSPSLTQSPSLSPSEPPSQRGGRVAARALDVELVGATPDAVATLIEFLYSGKTSGLHESNAAVVSALCKWFCMEDHLLYAALAVRAKSLHTADQWIDILLASTNLRRAAYKNIVIDYLLRRLMELPAAQRTRVMAQMPLQKLAAIEDADVVARVMLCMANHLRDTGLWVRLTFALELWLFWSFRRPFAHNIPTTLARSSAAVVIPARQPMSLLEFHRQFVSWEPVVRIQDRRVAGIDAYVAPTTLFRFGPFVVQVRFEPSGKPLILWRVVRAGTPADAENDDQSATFRGDQEPPFTVRGRLRIVYKSHANGPVHEDLVAVRYTHTREFYGKWQLLLSAPPSASLPRARLHAELEAKAQTEEPHLSPFAFGEEEEEETAPLPNDDSDSALEPEADEDVAMGHPLPDRQQQRQSDDASAVFEPMAARFSGQFFVWGHRLCNLYHFLLLSTLFYQVPHDASRELRMETTLTRMRELPFDTLVVVLQSDRLRVPEGETTLAHALAALCLSDFATMRYSLDEIHALFACVRWSFVDLEQIMMILERTRPEIKMYELIEQQLYRAGSGSGGGGGGGFCERRVPWGVSDRETPYRATTTLIEFQIEAGDRSLSPSKFLFSQE